MNLLLYILIIYLFPSMKLTKSNSRFENYRELLKWAKAEGFSQSKIHLNFTTNSETFISSTDIEKDEIIMSIPVNACLTFNSTYSKTSKKERKIWKQFNRENSTSFPGQEIRQQAFIALMLEHASTSKKGKFYEKYKSFIEFYRENNDNFPVFYSASEMDLISSTYFGLLVMKAREGITEENNYINFNLNTYSNLDLYMQYRVLNEAQTRAGSKNQTWITPFLILFDTETTTFNAIDAFDSDTQAIIIKAHRKIDSGEVIKLKSKIEDNTSNLIYYGKTFANAHEKTFFLIKAWTPELAQEWNYNYEREENIKFDLAKSNYIDQIVYAYSNITMEIYKESSDLLCFKTCLRNLISYLKNYDSIKPQDYYSMTLSEVNRVNIKKVVDEEIEFIKKRIEKLKRIIESIESGDTRWKKQPENMEIKPTQGGNREEDKEKHIEL